MTTPKVKLKSQKTREKLLTTLKPGHAFNLVHSRIEELFANRAQSSDRRRPTLRITSLEKARALWNQVSELYHDTPDLVGEVARSCGDPALAAALRMAQFEVDKANERYLEILSKTLECLAEEIALEHKLQPDADGHVLVC